MKLLQFCSIFLACGFFALTGCTGGTLGGVTVSLESLKPSPEGEGKVVATLQFSNENIVAFGVAQSSYTLYLNGKKIGEAQGEDAIPLPKMDRISQTIVFDVNASQLKELVASAEDRTASYKLETSLLVRSGEEKLRLKVEQSGAVDLRPLASTH